MRPPPTRTELTPITSLPSLYNPREAVAFLQDRGYAQNLEAALLALGDSPA